MLVMTLSQFFKSLTHNNYILGWSLNTLCRMYYSDWNAKLITGWGLHKPSTQVNKLWVSSKGFRHLIIQSIAWHCQFLLIVTFLLDGMKILVSEVKPCVHRAQNLHVWTLQHLSSLYSRLLCWSNPTQLSNHFQD